MLTKVEVITPQGTILPLPLQDISGGVLVKKIDGLDPVKATIVSSPFAQIDGTQYQSARRENRNMVLTVGLAPDYASTDVRTLRNYLYQFLMPKTTVTFKFYFDDVFYASIQGMVESCESALFSKDPEVNVSILCFKPDFVAPSSVVVSGHTVADTTEQVISYPGSTETGFLFKLSVNRTLVEFMLYARRPGGDTYSMEFAAPLAAGDLLEISTVVGNKYAYLTRAGTRNSILYGVSPVSSWMPLFPGENDIRVLTTGAAIPYTIEYTAKYGGL